MSNRHLRTRASKNKEQIASVQEEELILQNEPITGEIATIQSESNSATKKTQDTSSTTSTKTLNSTDYAVNRMQILDPFSVIINLAILSYKPINTKISIASNKINIQETGIFQALVRYIFQDSKYELNLLYNPIELACEYFLDTVQLNELPKVKHLFERALKGIEQLSITYADDKVICHCLNYYMSLIQNFLGDVYDENLFKLDSMTHHYKKDLIQKLNERWSIEKRKVISEMNDYLMKGLESSDNKNNKNDKNMNVTCMETFMHDIDLETIRIIYEA
jgi:hypothetical protein